MPRSFTDSTNGRIFSLSRVPSSRTPRMYFCSSSRISMISEFNESCKAAQYSQASISTPLTPTPTPSSLIAREGREEGREEELKAREAPGVELSLYPLHMCSSTSKSSSFNSSYSGRFLKYVMPSFRWRFSLNSFSFLIPARTYPGLNTPADNALLYRSFILFKLFISLPLLSTFSAILCYPPAPPLSSRFPLMYGEIPVSPLLLLLHFYCPSRFLFLLHFYCLSRRRSAGERMCARDGEGRMKAEK